MDGTVIMALVSIAVYVLAEATVGVARINAEVATNDKAVNQIEITEPEVDPG